MKRVIQLAALLAVLCSVGTASAQTTTFNGIVNDLTSTPVPSGNVTFTLKPGIDTTISGNGRFTPIAIVCNIDNAAISSITGTGTITVVFAVSQPFQIGDDLIFRNTSDATLNATTVAAPMVITGGSGTTFTFALTGAHTSGAVGTAGGIYAAAGTGPCVVTQNSALNPAYTSYSVAIQPAGTTTSSFNTYAIGAGPVDISTIVPTPSQQPSYSFVDLFSNGQMISGLKNFTNTGNTYSGGTFTNPILNNATFNTTTAANWLIIQPTIQQPVFTTQPITLSATHNYSINWANPVGAYTLTIPDPGANDTFAFLAAAQTFTNKTFGAGTVLSAIPTSINGYTLAAGIGLSGTVQNTDLTAQGGSIGGTPLYTYITSTTQTLAVVDYVLIVDGAAGSGTVSVTINWDDCLHGAAGTFTSSTINMGSAGQQVSGSVVTCPQSGQTIVYLTTDSSPGTGTYSLRLRTRLE